MTSRCPHVSDSLFLSLVVYFSLCLLPSLSLSPPCSCTRIYSVKQGYFPSHLAMAFSCAWIIWCAVDQLLPCVQVCNCNIWLCGCCCCIKQSCIHRSIWYDLSYWNAHGQTQRELSSFFFFCHLLFFPQINCLLEGFLGKDWDLSQKFSYVPVKI